MGWELSELAEIMSTSCRATIRHTRTGAANLNFLQRPVKGVRRHRVVLAGTDLVTECHSYFIVSVLL